MSSYVVGIHATGDLRSEMQQESLLHKFSLGEQRPFGAELCNRSMEVLLAEPLEIGVGGCGIIGRKITVWRGEGEGEDIRIAEGIVGFN
jgi:hypothetical protein